MRSFYGSSLMLLTLLNSLFISGFFTPSALAAEPVPTIRLDLEYPLNVMPVLNQGSSKLCYAYTAVQMVDFYRLKTLKQNRFHLTSPAKAAADAADLEWKNGNHQDIEPSGRAWDVISATRKTGSCNMLAVKEKFHDVDLGPFIEGLKLCRMQMQAVKATDWSKAKIQNTATTTRQCQQMVKTQSQEKPSLLRTYLALSSENPMSAFKSFFDQQCKGHVIPLAVPGLNVVSKEAYFQIGFQAKELTPYLSTVLRVRREPVGIDYCHHFLREPDYHGLVDGGLVAENCEMHASIVVGQRQVAGQTEFLIRDSWGNACDQYTADKECANGQVWVKDYELEANLTHVYFF